MYNRQPKKTIFTLNIYDGSMIDDVEVAYRYQDGNKEVRKVIPYEIVGGNVKEAEKIEIKWEILGGVTLEDGKQLELKNPEYEIYMKGVWASVIAKTKETYHVLDLRYAPLITDITYPLIKHYADKIRADWYIIKERKFPGWPIVYEKLQIYELAQEMQNDWNIYIDSDTLIHPDLFDLTNHIPKDTVAHNGRDMAGNRWYYDRFFKRDGRHIGSCDWFAIGSDWCIEFWKPLDDLTLAEAEAMISPTVNELNTLIKPGHLIDDFTLSRNIAKYGLKYTTFGDIVKGLNQGEGYLWHQYTIPITQKVELMKGMLKAWGLT